MSYPAPTPSLDPRVLFKTELTQAAQDPALAPLLRRASSDLPVRFGRYHEYLIYLPRRTRRTLRRQWKRSLAGLALLLALGQAPALAATINVTTNVPDINANDTLCSLIEAIDNANDTATGNVHGDCTPGDPVGADTLVLAPNSTHALTTVQDASYGDTGLPILTSVITIAGNGSTIQRGAGVGVPEFRLMSVGVGGNVTLNELTLTGGRLSYYGGIGRGAGVNNSGGTLTITDSTISGNTSGIDGGGVNTCGSRYHSATTHILTSTVSGNMAVAGGGGVQTCGYGTVTVTDSTVSGNAARVGGGIINSGGDALTITNSTVSGNTATDKGGGVVNYNNTLTISNSTISGNMAASNGGGVYVRGGRSPATLILNRTLVSGNTAPFGPEVSSATNDPYCHYSPYGCPPPGNVIADDFNLFGLDGTAGIEGFTPGANDIVPPAGVTLADILGPLASNGGPTRTHALVAGSPAIDASPVDASCQPTDQRGVSRPQGPACDIGAFEAPGCGPNPNQPHPGPDQGDESGCDEQGPDEQGPDE